MRGVVQQIKGSGGKAAELGNKKRRREMASKRETQGRAAGKEHKPLENRTLFPMVPLPLAGLKDCRSEVGFRMDLGVPGSTEEIELRPSPANAKSIQTLESLIQYQRGTMYKAEN
jgi:hypothetical protein